MKKQTFEQYLSERFADQYQGLDDEMPDCECDWIGALDVQEVIDWAEKWHKLNI